MSKYKTVARVGDIPPGEGRAFEVDGRMVAIFFSDGEYQAIDDLCPHMGASLAAGELCDGVVTCPWHAWRFRVSDGCWCDNPRIHVDSFDVVVEGDEIRVCCLAENADGCSKSDVQAADSGSQDEEKPE